MRQIAGLGVADAHRRLPLHEHQRHRLADDVASAHDDDIAAFDLNVLLLQKAHHSVGSARRKHRVADYQAADVVEMETIDVLVRGDGTQHAPHVDLWRQRQLHQDSMDVRIGVESLDRSHQLVGIDGVRIVQTGGAHAHLGARLDLAADING